MRAVLLAFIAIIILVRGASAQDMVAMLMPLAEQGNVAAQYRLGTLYANGDGVATDYKQAERWFDRASRGGNIDARRHLVFMRQLGLVEPVAGTPREGDAIFRVQVASVPSEAEAPREWRRLQRRFPEMLGTLEPAVVGFDLADGSRIFRLQGGPLDEEAARTVCAHLRNEGASCLIIRP
jgi:hypothetical protein